MTLTPMNILAILSVVLLFSVAAYELEATRAQTTAATNYVAAPLATTSIPTGASWQQEALLLGLATSTDPSAPQSGDSIDLITPQVISQLVGEYTGLQNSGTYSPQAAQQAAEAIAPNVKAGVAYTPYAESDVKTDANSSFDRMLAYRADMKLALNPLLKNTRAEYTIYADYVATGDKGYLRELQQVAQNYSDAAKAAAKITVPADIVETHLDIVNSLAYFSATLNSLATHASDPIASMALLRTYNDAETAVVTSFDRLAQYERLKQQ